MKRLSIRILVGLALVAALAAFVSVPIPKDEDGASPLPVVALEQTGLYRLEVALAVFYGVLLLITPAYSGLVDGRLPIEISARGAKFAEEANQSSETAEAAIRNLESASGSLSERLSAADLEIKRLNVLLRDNTEPKVDSKP